MSPFIRGPSQLLVFMCQSLWTDWRHTLCFLNISQAFQGTELPFLRRDGIANAGPDSEGASGMEVSERLLTWNGAALFTTSSLFPKLQQNSKCFITDSGNQKAASSWNVLHASSKHFLCPKYLFIILLTEKHTLHCTIRILPQTLWTLPYVSSFVTFCIGSQVPLPFWKRHHEC